ncbi:helix-turn-helix domain-containing protein [Cohnella sp. GCM10027633]|uniref:helix-turn-helix domain-containing protein n=1 Tax=unclassified Cohnella TaxID=2636738 RepID=UPI0036454CD8
MALKMVVAEDEQSFREGLISIVDWHMYDIEICGVAENGRQALEMIERERPDLLLTDIRMPYLNGLELIQQAKAAGAKFHAVLITGYNEFEYAREAIKLGVTDYLLKPCMPGDIVKVIMEVKRKIDQSEADKPYAEEMNRTWNRNIHLLKNQILTQWILQPRMPLENRAIVMREVDMALRPEPFELGLVRMDIDENKPPYESRRDLELIRYAVQNIAGESLEPIYGGKLEVFRHGEDLLWIGNLPENETDGAERSEAALRLLKINVESHVKLSISVSVSSAHASVNDAHVAYQEALEAMESRFYQGRGGIYRHADIDRGQSAATSILDDAYLQQWEKELLVQLQNEQYGEAVDGIEAGMRYLREQAVYSRAEIIVRVTSLILEIQKIAKERAGAIEWQDGIVDWMQRMPEMKSLDECASILTKLVQSFAAAALSRRTLHRTVQATLELIKAKYGTNLTLEYAAKETFVSNTYLSSLFKQEMGVGFLDYLHQYRVERAKELLRENYKVYAVAKLVGYQEERHFSSTFKKWTGLTPSQYQKGYVGE